MGLGLSSKMREMLSSHIPLWAENRRAQVHVTVPPTVARASQVQYARALLVLPRSS